LLAQTSSRPTGEDDTSPTVAGALFSAGRGLDFNNDSRSPCELSSRTVQADRDAPSNFIDMVSMPICNPGALVL
jgi:hypothetical protein